jgi:HK97 family phage major capsid protein
MNLTEMQDKRGRLVTQAREALDEIKTNTEESRATELEQRHDTIMGELDKIDAIIAKEERVAKLEAEAAERREQRRPDQSGEGRGIEEAVKPEYREVFTKLYRGGFDVQELSSEERQILKAGVADLKEVRAQTAGTAGAGGYTVPTELEAKISETLKMHGPMYDEAICTVITTSAGNPLDFPKTDDTAVAVAQHTEAAAMTDDGGSDATLTKLTLGAFAYDTEWVQVSMELLQDSAVDFEAFIANLLGKRLGRRLNTELTVGDGTGDPNGIVTASTLGVTAAATAAITADELIDLQHSVDPAYRVSPKARFMLNDSTLKAIRKLKDGNGNYLWQMGDFRTNAPGAILGSPYSVNQAMASLGVSAKVVIFGDFGEYLVRKVGAPVIGVRREYYWPNIGLAGIVRVDGDLLQTGAVKHLICAAS